MRLPEQVLVYGDRAVTPDPGVETLTDTVIQSAKEPGRRSRNGPHFSGFEHGRCTTGERFVEFLTLPGYERLD